MSPQHISSLINEELSTLEDRVNVYGLNLTECLIEPVKETYLLENQHEIELWTVLRESPTDYQYTIFYDEEEKMFGLGMVGKLGIRSAIGYHDSFLKALYSM